ncbi:hypothetical protein P2318_20495 [Myxococcaceae bacterium GXIMD 01537]
MRSFLATALVVFFLARPAVAAVPFDIQRHRESEAHPQLILAPRDGEVATLVIAFPAGRFDDRGQRGIIRLVQHVVLEANRRVRYEDFMREVYGAGASVELVTGLHQSSFVLTAHARDFDRLAGRLLTLVLSPMVDPARLANAAERTQLDPELNAGRASIEGWLAKQAVPDVRYQGEFSSQPPDVSGYTVESVREVLGSFLSPCNATVIAAGAINPKALRDTVKRFKGGLPTSVSKPELKLPVVEKLPAFNDVHVIAYPMELGAPKESAALRVLGAVLHHQLELRFRRAGVGYSFAAGPLLLPWMSGLLVTLPAEDPSKIDLGPFLLEEVARVRDGKVPPEWVMRARSRALAELRTLDASPEALALELTGALATPSWHDAAVAAELEALTPESFTRIISPWLQGERLIHLAFTEPVPRAPVPRPVKRDPRTGGRR